MRASRSRLAISALAAVAAVQGVANVVRIQEEGMDMNSLWISAKNLFQITLDSLKV